MIRRLALAAALGASVAQAQDSTSIILLGVGTPRPAADVHGPATAIVVGARTFLFDAGAGIMHQMATAGLGMRGPYALFLTHLHSDHTVGLPDVIYTSWVMERQKPFKVFGPPGTVRMVEKLSEAYSEDIAIRTDGLERNVAGGWRVNARDVKPGVVYDSGGVKVTAIKVPHGGWEWAYGYRVDTPTRSIVISGDTGPSVELFRAAAGVDVLIHETYPEPGTTANPTAMGHTNAAYFRAFHTSTTELGKLCAKAQPKLLLLTHVVRFGAADDELLAGVRTGGFAGDARVGKELVHY
ncbi:MAG TPA: MBL fold metallo-hydrolase [Gemmatimonadaceae bacterium]